MSNIILIDSIYINNSGGKVLLDYLVEVIIKDKNKDRFLFLLDPRGDYKYLSKIHFEFGISNERFRKKFYIKNKVRFSKVFCFGNVPPPIKLNIPVYTYFHNVLLAKSIDGYPLKTKILKYLKRLYIILKSNNTSEYWVQSELVKNLVYQNISSTKEIKVYPFFKLNRTTIRESKLSFVYVSDGNPHKNHKNLLVAWELLYNKGVKIPLHLTVSDLYPNIKNQIESLQKKNIPIINHGFTDTSILYKNSSFLIYPSLTESFGLGLVEAVNAGLEVIASNLSFVNEVIEPTMTFNPYDPNSIASSVLELIKGNQTKKSKIVIKNSINSILEELTEEKYYTQ